MARQSHSNLAIFGIGSHCIPLVILLSHSKKSADYQLLKCCICTFTERVIRVSRSELNASTVVHMLCALYLTSCFWQILNRSRSASKIHCANAAYKPDFGRQAVIHSRIAGNPSSTVLPTRFATGPSRPSARMTPGFGSGQNSRNGRCRLCRQ